MSLFFILQIVSVVVLVCISAFCSSAEMALFSLSRPKVLSYRDSKDSVKKRIWYLMEDQHRTLITIIFCNMLVNSMVSMLNETILLQLHLSPTVTLVVSAFTGIVILLLFGEISPMTVAYIYCDQWSRVCANPVYYARKILAPLTYVVEKICDRILNFLGRAKPEGLQPEEYLSYIDVCAERGVFTHDEAKLMKETFALRNKTVESVMRTRAALCYATPTDSPDDIRKMIRKYSQAYLPVSRELRLDSADSILSARLFFAMTPAARKNWIHSSCVLAHTVFIPEKTTLEKALHTLKKNGVYAALAADEYGAVSGIITREDIYSELTGRSVELDEKKNCDMVKIDNNTFIFDGMAPVEFANTVLPVPLPSERFSANTLNGIFCEVLGEIPHRDSKITIDNITLQVRSVYRNRITRLTVTCDPEKQSEVAE